VRELVGAQIVIRLGIALAPEQRLRRARDEPALLMSTSARALVEVATSVWRTTTKAKFRQVADALASRRDANFEVSLFEVLAHGGSGLQHAAEALAGRGEGGAFGLDARTDGKLIVEHDLCVEGVSGRRYLDDGRRHATAGVVGGSSGRHASSKEPQGQSPDEPIHDPTLSATIEPDPIVIARVDSKTACVEPG
jgi:hypothetical protein